MRAVTINTYAGSLLLGAKWADVPVDASLEDSDFGVDIQRMNFPDLKIYRDIRSWPKMDLREHVVIAHPPCSAFSKQNNSPRARGTDSSAFRCTVNVMMYGMIQKAKVIAIESVPGALEGAWEVHDEYAGKYGYAVYRIMMNYASFGLPQWRPRFWALFVRKDQDPGEWPMEFKPKYVELNKLIGDEHLQDSWRKDAQVIKSMPAQIRKWLSAGATQEIVDETLSGKRGHGMTNSLIGEPWEYDKYAISRFRSSHLRLLNTEGFAPVLMNGCSWLWNGRPLTVEEYFIIMGFPTDYKMPHSYFSSGKYKMYLSKGVCPQVAQWILEQCRFWWTGPNEHDVVARPNDITDLRPASSRAKTFKKEDSVNEPFAWMMEDEDESDND